MDDINLQYNKFTQLTNELENICYDRIGDDRESETEACQVTLDSLKQMKNKMESKFELIDSYKHINIRQRRAPLEIVGTIGYALFGFLSQEDAMYYNTEIELLKQKKPKSGAVGKQKPINY
jgi:hypothetical protein